MLAFLAILGAFGAGYVADSLMRPPAESEEEGAEDSAEDDDAPPPAEEDPALDWIFADDSPAEDSPAENSVDAAAHGTPSGFVDDGMPVSDDIPDPVAAPVVRVGTAADDILSGGGGADRLSGGAGDDQLTGRGGDDRLTGGSGRDHLDGGEGDDSLSGQGGADVLMGGAGNDLLSGGKGADHLAGGEGDDRLIGGGGAQDTLDGGSGHDTLWGGFEGRSDAAVDVLNGGAGDDVLHIGPGDIAMGGAGADSFQLQDHAPGLPLSEITDYSPEEDEILVLYDPAIHPLPDLTAEAVEGSQDVTLLLDGVAVALIRDAAGLDLSLIRLQAA